MQVVICNIALWNILFYAEFVLKLYKYALKYHFSTRRLNLWFWPYSTPSCLICADKLIHVIKTHVKTRISSQMGQLGFESSMISCRIEVRTMFKIKLCCSKLRVVNETIFWRFCSGLKWYVVEAESKLLHLTEVHYASLAALTWQNGSNMSPGNSNE